MTTLRAATLAALQADSTLSGLATVITDANALGKGWLELADVQTGSDPTVQPTVFVRWTTDEPRGSAEFGGHIAMCEVWFYTARSYETIRQMREAVRAVLDEQTLAFDEPSDDYLGFFRWAGTLKEQIDDSLGGAFCERDRYAGYMVR